MNTNMSKSNEQNEKETRKFCLYAHINMINGKIYIGQTCNPLYKRWKDGLGYIGNKHFYNSINKYGWDNFKHISLIENLNGDYANIIEKELIKKYNTTNPDFGYNILMVAKIEMVRIILTMEITIRKKQRKYYLI